MQPMAMAVASAALIVLAVCHRRRVAAERRSRELLKFVFRALCDSPCEDGPATVIYACCQTDDNASSVADGVVEARRLLPAARTLLVLDLQNEKMARPMPNYGGPEVLLRLLSERGITDATLLPFSEPNANTLNEMEIVVRMCRGLRARSLCIVSPPFHLPRALLTAQSVAQREHPALRVHVVPGGRPNSWWAEEAAHSQGVVRGIRTDLIIGEIERIEAYSAKGDLLSPVHGLGRLASRDRAIEETRRCVEPSWKRSPQIRPIRPSQPPMVPGPTATLPGADTTLSDDCPRRSGSTLPSRGPSRTQSPQLSGLTGGIARGPSPQLNGLRVPVGSQQLFGRASPKPASPISDWSPRGHFRHEGSMPTPFQL